MAQGNESFGDTNLKNWVDLVIPLPNSTKQTSKTAHPEAERQLRLPGTE